MHRWQQTALALVMGSVILGSLAPGVALAADALNDGRYIIKMRPPGAAAARALGRDSDDLTRGRGATTAAGGIVVQELARQGSVVALLSDEGAARLQADPEVERVEPDYRRYPQAETKPYGITMVQADDAFFVAHPTTSNSMVCIIDSGYQAAHEDLADVLPSGSTITGTQNAGTGNWYEDSCGHGSHVAGTISALGGNDVGVLGVNSNGAVNLHIQKVFNGSACGWSYASDLVSAVNNCVFAAQQAQKWMVISMSLGGGGNVPTEDAAFQAAYDAGYLPVAAAGNDGISVMSYPAAYASVMSVAAVDSTGAAASFSNFSVDVEIAAPGVDVLSSTPFAPVGLTVGTGTWAGSAVTGAAAVNATGVLVDGGYCQTANSAWLSKLVLCKRGSPNTTSVTFATKAARVKTGGGVGVIIFNDQPGALSGTLLPSTSTLPVIALSDVDGAAALQVVGSAAQLTSGGIGNGYEYYSGTSMATPHVSGVAALIWGLLPNRSAAQVRQALTSSALDLGAPGRDVHYGYGLVQAKAAYDALLALPDSPLPPPPPPPPVVPTYTLTPAALSFGSQTVNTSVQQVLTVVNTGTVALPVSSITLSSSPTGQFSGTHTCGTQVLVGSSCSITVTFKPTSSGSKTGAITFNSSGGAPSTAVNLSGTGVVPVPVFTLSATALAYAGQTINTSSTAQLVTLTNTGAAAMAVATGSYVFSPTGQFSQTNTCGTSVAAGASCTINVVFRPTTAGAKSATLSVTPTGGTAKTVSLSGTGLAAVVGVVSLNPTTLAFGTQARNSSSIAQPVTVTNSGTVSIASLTIRFTGSNTSHYSQTNNCNTALAVGATCTVNVVFRPTSTGARNSTLSITPAGGAAKTVSLTGTGR